mmetsp:Transcript_1111/g.3502  ORF Transcript_1111/g.3502 Transcript_1111/m.3502 type:complete len:312 (+) Transcript_1111:71-1006(+)
MKGHEDSNPDVAFEALVRAQLTRMGYDASAVPDEMLRAFLREYHAAPHAPPPLSAAQPPPRVSAAAYPASEPVDEAPSGLLPERRRGDVERASPARGAPSCRPAETTAPTRGYPSPPAARGGAASSATPASSGLGRARRRTPRGSAPEGASPPLPPHRGSAGGESVASSGAEGSSASLIRKVDLTPRRPRQDVVASYHRHAAAWSSSGHPFLGPREAGRRTPRSPPQPQPPAAQSPWRPRSVKAPPQFVVPTSKRRDDVVCAVRERLRASEPVDDGRRPARRLTPNHFVPPTEKRRDALRWQVRVGMACAY